MNEIMTKARARPQFRRTRLLNRLKLTSIGSDDNTEGGDDAQEGDAHGVHAEGDPARRPLDEVVGLCVLIHEAVNSSHWSVSPRAARMHGRPARLMVR